MTDRQWSNWPLVVLPFLSCRVLCVLHNGCHGYHLPVAGACIRLLATANLITTWEAVIVTFDWVHHVMRSSFHTYHGKKSVALGERMWWLLLTCLVYWRCALLNRWLPAAILKPNSQSPGSFCINLTLLGKSWGLLCNRITTHYTLPRQQDSSQFCVIFPIIGVVCPC